jgi:hypothetical protein
MRLPEAQVKAMAAAVRELVAAPTVRAVASRDYRPIRQETAWLML